MERRMAVLLVAVVVAAVLVACVVPAQFATTRVQVPPGAQHPPFVPSGPYWVPVWALGPGELVLPGGPPAVRAEGRYVLLPLLLVGEFCLVGALAGAAVLALLSGKRRAGSGPG